LLRQIRFQCVGFWILIGVHCVYTYTCVCIYKYQCVCICIYIQCVPLATEPGWLADRCSVSQQLGALQTHTTDTFFFISHTTNLLLFKFRCNIFIGVRIIKEMPGSVASGTPVYRVIQEESAILWEMRVCVILSKNVHMNMGPILDGYGVMGIY